MSNAKLFQPINSENIPTMDSQNSNISDIQYKKKRHIEVDRMYDQYIEYMKKPIVISYATFKEFEELYQRKALDEINDPTSNKFQYYTELLKKLFSIINPYKEYHVLMPNNEVVTFPPLLIPVSNINNDQIESIDVFSNILDKCIDQPWKRKSATVQLLKAIYSSQNPALIKYQTEKIKHISNKIEETVNGHNTVQTNNRIENSTAVDSMEFTLDD